MNDGRIISLRDKFLENLQYQWTIEEMTNEVNLSPPQLQKIFKSQIGMPPIAYAKSIWKKRGNCSKTVGNK